MRKTFEQQQIMIDREQKIMGFMVMDDGVIKAASVRYAARELKTQHFSETHRMIFRWLMRFYEKYGKAPQEGVNVIYERESRGLTSERREIIAATLDNLSQAHTQYDDYSDSGQLVAEEDIPDFIREKELADRMDKLQTLVDKQEFEKAEALIAEHQVVATDLHEEEQLGTIFPATYEDAVKARSEGDLQSEIAYQFEGDLGRIVGPLRKSWLVAVTGIEKSGKSFLLDEIGYDAAFNHGKKVLKINLELSATLQRLRTQKWLTRTCDEHQAGDIIYPVLDCENNQHGNCKINKMRRAMRSKKPLLASGKDVATYEYNKKWSTCTLCKDNPKLARTDHPGKRFIPTVWFAHSKVKAFDIKYMKRAVKFYRQSTLQNFRVKCFPRFSVTFEEIRNYINRYAEKYDWMPDIVLLDYLDITAPQDKEQRLDIDMKWKQASQLAGELDCLVINADQAVKAGRQAYQLTQMSTSESKTKDAHLDVRIALNQQDFEKQLGVARLNVIFHRHQEFAIGNEVMITQRLATSSAIIENTRIWQQLLDSKVWPKKL